MKRLREDGRDKVLLGLTSPEEVLRVTAVGLAACGGSTFSMYLVPAVAPAPDVTPAWSAPVTLL